MHFHTNIRLLHERRNRTQQVVADELKMVRSTLNSHESGNIKNPTVQSLVLFSNYFRVSIDRLVKFDLHRCGEFQLSELERGNDITIIGIRLFALPALPQQQTKS